MTKEFEKKVRMFIQCFGTDSGQEVFEDLYRHCQVDLPSLTKNKDGSVDSLHMAYKDGAKSVYWYIKKLIETDLPTG